MYHNDAIIIIIHIRYIDAMIKHELKYNSVTKDSDKNVIIPLLYISQRWRQRRS